MSISSIAGPGIVTRRARARWGHVAVIATLATAVPALASGQGQPDSAHAVAGDTAIVLHFGGFVDTYYAWDFDRPRSFDRAYTTQPARHAEANVNLAFVESSWSGPRTRGRLALQWGTSVQANYASEPRIGNVSGPDVRQFLQEAYVGYKAAPSLWIDAGIFAAHVGYESWISRDNLTYTRSLVAEYSPYFETGIRATWNPASRLTLTSALVNGWQNASAENSAPSGGIRIDYVATPRLTLTYDNFVGNVAADTEPVRVRLYHDVIAQYNPGDSWKLALVYSLGTEARRTSLMGTASWWGGAAIAKYKLSHKLSIVGRTEYYADPSQVVVVTGTNSSFEALAASLGTDVTLPDGTLWRTEFRGFHSPRSVWPLHSADGLGTHDEFLVMSLAHTF
mgnify:FL=1